MMVGWARLHQMVIFVKLDNKTYMEDRSILFTKRNTREVYLPYQCKHINDEVIIR